MLKNITLLLAIISCSVGVQPTLRLGRPVGRIVGGHDARKGEFPYQISLQQVVLIILRQHICGGSIISPSWVVTAGHCIPEYGTLEVVAGEHNLNSNEGTEQTVRVSQAIVHPRFEGDVAPYDIALVKLQSPLVFDEHVQPISLPVPDSIPSGNSILSGWGSISTTNNPSMPANLQTADLPIIDYDTCLETYGSDSPLDPSNVCTGPLSGGFSACSGDSGGPLVKEQPDGSRELIGIVSWGVIPCGQSNAPSVYTRVSAYIDWINDNAQ
ncbi:trypsin-1-like [Zootermopsis nevadensis]|uniref:Trypsin-1 n=1 Tax=Zootermopsis nevadensis TaxID=136037 RepID=A0A067RAJ4_ZOONE|nr:trypsin-1-like [Zootermopsis nevadensis]KDR20688.1 Trypsin-1 [Zootermopsis nevadensis]